MFKSILPFSFYKGIYLMWGFIIAAVATIFVGIFSAKTSQATAKKAGSQQEHTAITLADKQIAADEAARSKASEEQKIQDKKLSALQEKQLKIQAQQFNIETLAGILKGRKTTTEYPIVYQTPPARVETGIMARINDFFHNLLRG